MRVDNVYLKICETPDAPGWVVRAGERDADDAVSIYLLRLDNKQEEALSSLQMAVDIAKQQKALLYQLKAAIDMANAASSMGQPERGLQPLCDLCANLPHGFDAPQLAEAKRLLSK